jgi:hypothetical protein
MAVKGLPDALFETPEKGEVFTPTSVASVWLK